MITDAHRQALSRYVDGICSEEDVREVLALVRASHEARLYLARLLAHEKTLRDIVLAERRLPTTAGMVTEGLTGVSERRRGPRVLGLTVAAAATLVLAVGLWWGWRTASDKPDTANDTSVVAKARGIAGPGVEVLKGGVGAWRRLMAGESLEPGDAVRTTDSNEVTLAYADGTELLMRERSEVGLRRSQGKQVTLEKGAVVALVAKQPPGRPMLVDTPHVRCTVKGTKFFLMVIGGTMTNGAPWGYTRADVTEGSVELRTVTLKPGTADPEPFGLYSGQFVAVGTDHHGTTVQTGALKSEGRELSSRYGGVFFRETAEAYWRGKFALDVLPMKEAKKWALTPDELLRHVTHRSPGMSVDVKKVESNEASPLAILLMKPSAPGVGGTVLFDLPVRKLNACALEFRGGALAVSGSGSFGYGGSDVDLVDRPVIDASVSGHKNRTAGTESKNRYRIERVRVGMLPSGGALYEQRVWEVGTPKGTAWTKDDASTLKFTLLNIAFGLEDVCVTELVR